MARMAIFAGMKLAGNHYCSTEDSRRTSPMADNTVPGNGIPLSYFCGQEKKSMPNGNIFYLCNALENSVSYGVTVERNRQILATEHTDRYVPIGVLFSVIQLLRGVWRCPFYLKDGKGALFSYYAY